jgi:hypothetical protein
MHTVTFRKVSAIDYVVLGGLQGHRFLRSKPLLLWLLSSIRHDDGNMELM